MSLTETPDAFERGRGPARRLDGADRHVIAVAHGARGIATLDGDVASVTEAE